MQLARTIVFELVQALKFKTILPDANILRLLQVAHELHLVGLLLRGQLDY